MPPDASAAMRAAIRALPCCGPAPRSHSPPCLPGSTQTTSCAARARRRWNACSPSPTSLLDTLWRNEREAQLAALARRTRRGLKARLLAHVDAIAHPDIKRALSPRAARPVSRPSRSRPARHSKAARAPAGRRTARRSLMRPDARTPAAAQSLDTADGPLSPVRSSPGSPAGRGELHRHASASPATRPADARLGTGGGYRCWMRRNRLNSASRRP